MLSTHPQLPDVQSIHDQFARDGFYLAKNVYDSARIASLEHDFDRIVDQLIDSGEEINAAWKGEAADQVRKEGMKILHTHHVHCYSALWLAAMQDTTFLHYAKAILGPDVILHHSKLFQKPGGEGAPFPMHQDWGYFPTEKNSMIAGVIHVSAATDEMGCFRVYPGSHQLGRQANTKGTGDKVASLMEQYPLEEATVLEAAPGDVLFFHYFLLHGSKPNFSDQTRKTVLVQMHAGDDLQEAVSTHPYARLPLCGWNHRAKRSSVSRAS